MILRTEIALALGLDTDPDETTSAMLVERARSVVAENEALRKLVATAWVEIRKRWSKIDAGALVVDDRARVWVVVDPPTVDAFKIVVRVRQAGAERVYEREVDREADAAVLEPVPVRNGLVLLRGELGAQLQPPEPPMATRAKGTEDVVDAGAESAPLDAGRDDGSSP